MRTRTKRPSSWEPGSTPATLVQVWDYVSEKIRESRLQLGGVEARYYGKYRNCEEQCRGLCIALRNSQRKDSYKAIKKTLAGKENDLELPVELRDWTKDLLTVRESLRQLSHIFQSEIFSSLTTYCSSYFPTIGASDDKLFTLYRSKIISIKKTMTRMQYMLTNLEQVNTQINVDEMELLQCHCQGGHTLTKVVPLLIEDFEEFLDKSYDWLTIDKCYMDEIKDTIAKESRRFKELDKQYKLSAAVYHTALVTLRREKVVFDALLSEIAAFNLRELKNAELRSHRIDLEIRTLEQTLDQVIRDEMAEDVPDCCLEEIDVCRNNSDRAYYQKRLELKRNQQKEIIEQLEDYKNLSREKQQTEQQIKILTKNVNKSRRQRDKVVELRDSCHDKVSTLDKLYEQRRRPSSTTTCHLTWP